MGRSLSTISSSPTSPTYHKYSMEERIEALERGLAQVDSLKGDVASLRGDTARMMNLLEKVVNGHMAQVLVPPAPSNSSLVVPTTSVASQALPQAPTIATIVPLSTPHPQPAVTAPSPQVKRIVDLSTTTTNKRNIDEEDENKVEPTRRQKSSKEKTEYAVCYLLTCIYVNIGFVELCLL